ncbi:MAG: tRNA methyl transferase PRC-barrel domain-containing protein [Collinsella sp.]
MVGRHSGALRYTIGQRKGRRRDGASRVCDGRRCRQQHRASGRGQA